MAPAAAAWDSFACTGCTAASHDWPTRKPATTDGPCIRYQQATAAMLLPCCGDTPAFFVRRMSGGSCCRWRRARRRRRPPAAAIAATAAPVPATRHLRPSGGARPGCCIQHPRRLHQPAVTNRQRPGRPPACLELEHVVLREPEVLEDPGDLPLGVVLRLVPAHRLHHPRRAADVHGGLRARGRHRLLQEVLAHVAGDVGAALGRPRHDVRHLRMKRNHN